MSIDLTSSEAARLFMVSLPESSTKGEAQSRFYQTTTIKPQFREIVFIEIPLIYQVDKL